ncbi:MAG: hypothetical protein HFG66_06060 [Hungatella sp.]|jgi:hypothetical protein|nr:hypothetical protein [Hungatella sp.]
MINIHTDRDDFDLGIEDFGISEGSDINLYVLDENMKALSLMEAFRSCRYNPLRTYYYIPETESNFSRYAMESISRGTVNIFTDLEELREALNGEMDAWRSYSVPECIAKSANHFKVLLNRDMSTSLSVAVSGALRKNSCYTVAVALFRMLQAKEQLNEAGFEMWRKQVLETSPEAVRAEEEYQKHGSQFLSVLAAAGKEIDEAWGTEEYDEMTLHVMFQPFEPEGRGINHRVKIVSQLVKEKKRKH